MGQPTGEKKLELGVATLTEAHRISLPQGETSHTKSTYPPGTLLGSYFYIENKGSGVEPGFLAICIDEDQAFCKYVFDKYKNQGLNSFNAAEVKAWLIKNKEKAKELAEELARTKTLRQRFTCYLIKQDYTDPIMGHVTIPFERAQQSNTIQKLYKIPLVGRFLGWVGARIMQLARFMTRSTATENRNALLESLATDIARQAYGMECQEQTVLFGTYPNGRLKILTRSKWDFDIKPLGEPHGGNSKTSGNYLVSSKPPPPYISNTSIRDLGENFIPLLAQGDMDGIGSMAQNKAQKKGRLFGLDFGQAYRDKNPAIDTLQDDFSYKDPTGYFEPGFKNFSIFSDTSLQDKMKGVHYIRKLVTGLDPPDEVLAEYGQEFKDRISKMHGGGTAEIFSGYIAIFNEYIKKLEVLVKEANKKNNKALVAEYRNLIKEIKNSRDNEINVNDKILKIFESRLKLTPTQLNILEACEKLTSETSLTSYDGTVLLNHMQVTARVPWEMHITHDKVNGDKCVLIMGKLSPLPWPKNWFSKDNRKQEAYDRLCKYIDAHPEVKSIIQLTMSTGSPVISFDKSNSAKVTKIFNEAMVQQYKHKEKVELRKKLISKTTEQPDSQQQQILQLGKVLEQKKPMPITPPAPIEKPTQTAREQLTDFFGKYESKNNNVVLLPPKFCEHKQQTNSEVKTYRRDYK